MALIEFSILNKCPHPPPLAPHTHTHIHTRTHTHFNCAHTNGPWWSHGTPCCKATGVVGTHTHTNTHTHTHTLIQKHTHTPCPATNSNIIFTNVLQYMYHYWYYLPRLAMLWSSNMLHDRSSEVNVVFIPTALHTSLTPCGPSPQPHSPSDVRTLFSLNIVPV